MIYLTVKFDNKPVGIKCIFNAWTPPKARAFALRNTHRYKKPLLAVSKADFAHELIHSYQARRFNNDLSWIIYYLKHHKELERQAYSNEALVVEGKFDGIYVPEEAWLNFLP